MKCLHCQPLTSNYLPVVLTLDALCFGGLWSRDAYQREIDSPNSALLVLIKNNAGQEPAVMGVGCAWFILDEAHITLLGIDPVYQGQGLGQWLLLHLLKAACDRGLTHATLEVRKSNHIALSIYEKFGFKVAGERKKYYTDGETALILWKRGLQNPPELNELERLTAATLLRLNQRGWQAQNLPQFETISLP